MTVVNLEKFRKAVKKLLADFPINEVNELLEWAISAYPGRNANEIAAIIASQILEDRWEKELTEDPMLEELCGIALPAPKP